MIKFLLWVLVFVQIFSAWQLQQIRTQENFSVYIMGQAPVKFDGALRDLGKSLKAHGWTARSGPLTEGVANV